MVPDAGYINVKLISYGSGYRHDIDAIYIPLLTGIVNQSDQCWPLRNLQVYIGYILPCSAVKRLLKKSYPTFTKVPQVGDDIGNSVRIIPYTSTKSWEHVLVLVQWYSWSAGSWQIQQTPWKWRQIQTTDSAPNLCPSPSRPRRRSDLYVYTSTYL